MQVFDAAATLAALPFERLIPALQALFVRGCVVPARQVHAVVPQGLTSLIMPAWLPGRYYGVKTVNIAPGNAARGLPGLHATYLLYDAGTGQPLAWIDGNQITSRRTAAASALAASWLAPAQASHLLVVGAGQVASLLPEAMRVVRPTLTRFSLWARSAARADAVVAAWRQQGLDAHRVDDLATAAARADIVSCATLATAPVVQGHWLKAGSHLDLIGSFTPAMREADDACFEGALLYVDTEEALHKSGDLLGPLSRGVIRPDELCGTLASLSSLQARLQATRRQRTVFKSVGTALEDLAAAMLVHESGTPSGSA